MQWQVFNNMRYSNQSFLSSYEQLYTIEQLDEAITTLASEITNDYLNKQPLLISVMNGALITTGHLLCKLDLAVDVDYCHATRYGNKTVGGELQWLAFPQHELKGRNILLVDDIFDEGITLKLIAEYCQQQGAAEVKSLALLDKAHDRKAPNFSVDYIGLTIPDRYVFGFGLDYEGNYRNAPGIFALMHS